MTSSPCFKSLIAPNIFDAHANANAISLRGGIMYNQSIGGSGGGGGNGGNVSLANSVSGDGGVVRTYGDNSIALFAQSIGGGGGNGGSVNSVAAASLGVGKGLSGLADKFLLGASFTGSLSLGGTGGSGGTGGRVDVSTAQSSLLLTAGSHASGIFAQSVGGGGGTGGGGTERTAGTFALKVSIGRTGGQGGTGGAVSVSQKGTIATRGDASYGIYAQSVGGGGGDGGNFTAAPALAPDTISVLTARIETAIGAAKFAAWVAKKGMPKTVEKLNELIADLNSSEFAESVRNSDLYKQVKELNSFIKEQHNAGLGFPDLTVSVSIGGNGGSGNAGGQVDIVNKGDISTAGNVAHGIFAQSVGGGGGNGGTAYGAGTSKQNLVFSFGGSGGAGGAGGTVTVANDARIHTDGDGSYGILAQSVGGGGGTGVGAVSGKSKPKSVTIDLALGGSGGVGNIGGAVSVTNSGTIATTGAEAHAIFAQSVGGGGGVFQTNLETKDAQGGADSSEIVPDSTMIAFLQTFGLEEVPKTEKTDPIAAKFSLGTRAFALGGTGGAGNDGGAVRVVHSGFITTSGTGAFGIFAQSVGAGGGISDGPGASADVERTYSFGGKGGAAGNGGTVSIDLTGNGRASQISTSGDAATAVFAQSIGGGGGYGGASIFFGKSELTLGGVGGSNGNGGAISITGGPAGTAISTTGNFAHGIWAQSLGGGGGATRTVLNLPGAAGATTTPTNSRSAALGSGGTIDITIANGAISATGADSFGLLAQSGFQTETGRLDPSKLGSSISINYTGTILGGSGNGAAIGVDGGNANFITIGAGSNVSALSGKAILGSFGSHTVVNHGTVSGDIDLALSKPTGTWNAFTNEVDGTYRSNVAGTVNLGSWAPGFSLSTFTNRGTFDIAGVGTIGTATIATGTLDLGGTLLVDVTSTSPVNGRTSDLLQASQLKLDGVSIHPYAVGGLLPGNFTVVTAQGIQAGGTPATVSASPWSPISWSVSQSANALTISPSASFLATAQSLPSSPLTLTERAMLQSAQLAWNRGDSNLAVLFAQAANITTPQQYANMIDSASASESNNLPTIGQALAALQSLNAAMSCPAFEGNTLEIHEGECVWSRVTGSKLQRSAASQGEGFAQTGVDYRIGGQWEIASNWYFGATAGYKTSSLSTSDSLSSTSGSGGDVSLALKHQMGPLLLAASVQAGYSSYQTSNTLIIGTQQGFAGNDMSVWTAGLKLRAAYEFTFENWYLRPYIDLDVLHSAMPGYAFSVGGMSISSESIDHWAGALEAVVEVGSRFNVGNNGWIRPFVGVGATFVANNHITTQATFTDGLLNGLSFNTTQEIPNALLDLGAGLQFMSGDTYELRAQYRAQMANDFLNQELSLRASLRF